MTGIQWELMNSTTSSDSDAPDVATSSPRRRWPELAAVGVVVCVIALLASTGPTPAEIAERLPQPTVPERAPVTPALVDRTLLKPGETVASADPLVVLAPASAELDFFPGVLGKEEPFVEILGVDGAVVLATSNLTPGELAEAAGANGTFAVEKVTLIGRVEGRLVSVVQSTVTDDARLRCDGLRDNGPVVFTDCAPLGLPQTPEPAAFESAMSTMMTETHIYVMGLAAEVAVVSVSSDEGEFWQRPVGGVAVLPTSNDPDQPPQLTLFDAKGKLIAP